MIRDRPLAAAVCSCGGAVFHESAVIVGGFVIEHVNAARAGCGRVEVAADLEAARVRFSTPEAEGVLFL